MLKKDQRLGELPSSKSAYQQFLEVAWPSALESLLISLISAADTIMVGSLGEAAIAAVGITNQPRLILLAAILSLNVGVTAIVARRRGQGDRAGANACLRQGLILCIGLAFIMCVVGFLFAEEIMAFAGAGEDYLADAVAYFQILVVSIFFTSVNLTVNAAQRGCGNTKIAMQTNIISNIVNIIFNYFLINGIGFFPRLEIRGAAIATVIGAASACLISFYTLLHKDGFLSLYEKGKWKLELSMLKLFGSISGSALVEQFFVRIGFLAYAIIVAKLGTTVYATHLICMNIFNISFSLGDGCGIAASSLVGQSLGKKRPDLAIMYGKIGQRIAVFLSAGISLVYIFGKNILVSLYTKDPAVMDAAADIMILMSFATFMQTSQVVISGCLRGAGDTAFVAVSSLISIGIIRPIMTWMFCLPLGWGLIGAWVALCIDQILRLVLNYWRFSGGKWTKINI